MISIREIVILGTVCVVTFALTFVPFVIGHFDDFRKMNPFIIQSSFLMPLAYTAFCVLLAFGSVFVVKKKSDVYFYNGFLLFFTVILHYAYKLTIHGFAKTFFGDRADISYFILCVPFVLYYLAETEDVTKFR
jgi:predicted Na+-dependent transporter